MKNIQTETIWTIGHSTRTLDEFIAMLRALQIELVADIRKFPGSAKYPQFNRQALQISLGEYDIDYIHLENLGGRRKKRMDSLNTAWRNPSFQGYADHMETADFRKGLKELIKQALKKRSACMCSEAVWWRCHRALVSDALKVRGWKVLHIMGLEKVVEHPYTSPAKIIGTRLSYEKG